MSHTKGEWKTVFRNETGWDYKTQSEKQIRMVYVDDVNAGEIVCRIFGHPDIKVQEDRARLIAAAPDLLRVCKAMKKVWWMVGNRITLAGTLPAQIEQIGKQADAAIAKAKKEG